MVQNCGLNKKKSGFDQMNKFRNNILMVKTQIILFSLKDRENYRRKYLFNFNFVCSYLKKSNGYEIKIYNVKLYYKIQIFKKY